MRAHMECAIFPVWVNMPDGIAKPLHETDETKIRDRGYVPMKPNNKAMALPHTRQGNSVGHGSACHKSTPIPELGTFLHNRLHGNQPAQTIS